MRKLLWFVLLIVAVNAVDEDEERDRRREVRAAKTAESKSVSDDDTDVEGRRPRRHLYLTSESISKTNPTAGAVQPSYP